MAYQRFYDKKSGKYRYRDPVTLDEQDMVLAIETYSPSQFRQMTARMGKQDRRRE